MMRFINPKTDFAFKKIFGTKENKHILISFLNAIIYEGKNTIKDLEIIDPYQAGKMKGIKDSFLDVKAILDNQTRVIIEMQCLNQPGFEKRILYNAAKAYSNQLRIKQVYGQLNPVIGLTIIDFNLFKNSEKVIYRFEFKEQDELFDYPSEISLIFVELPKFKKELEELETITDKWLYFMKNAPDLKIVPNKLGSIGAIQDALTIANLANFTEQEIDDLESHLFFVQAQEESLLRAEQAEQKLEEKDKKLQEKDKELEEKDRRQKELFLRTLSKKIGSIDETIKAQINNLSEEKLEELAEVFLDFNDITDLTNWLLN